LLPLKSQLLAAVNVESYLDHRFVFVAGHHRSGTSLLHRVLREHPMISGFKGTGAPEDEGQHLQSVFLPAKAFGGAGKYIFNSASHMDECHELVSEASAQRIFDDWSRYWDTSQPWLVEKSPPNLVRTRFLQRLFPRSVFIGIMRHSVAVSYATQKWSHNDIVSLLDHTLLGYEILEKDSRLLDTFCLIRYEDLILNPQACIDGLLSNVGLPSYPVDQNVLSGVNEKYFMAWKSDREGRALMSGLMLGQLEERCGRFGYSLSGCSGE